jgi:PAS domain S-box-containing protein
MATRNTKKAKASDSGGQIGEAFTHAPIGMVLATPGGEISDANFVFLQLLSHKREDVVGKNITEFTHPDDRRESEAFFQLLREGTNDSAVMETRYLRADGDVVWVRVSMNAIRNDQQVAERLIGVIENITETKDDREVARALEESERHLRVLADSLPQMIWTATAEGMLDYLSEQGLRYLGIPEQGLYGEKWLAAVHPEDRNRVVRVWADALELSQPYETSYRLRRFDGAWRWQLVRGLPLKNASGRVTKWHGTCTDIQEQKQAEVNLRQQWATFDTALSYTPDSVYIFDLDGRFTYANDALLKLLGKPADEVIGTPFLNFHATTPPHRDMLQQELADVIRHKERRRGRAPFTDAHGETREFEHILVPILGDDGEVRAVAGASRDITQQKHSEEMVQKDRRRWQELLLNAPAAIAIFRGPQHVFEWVNSDFLRLVGRQSEGQLIGRTAGEALPEVAPQGYLEVLDQVYRKGEPQIAHEAEVTLGEGKEARLFYINFVCMPTRNINGQTDGNFVHATDVTDLVKARKQVEESERQFRTLAETIPHLTWMAHANGDIFWYNQRWYDYTGTTIETIKGWQWEKVHDPEMLPHVIEEWKRSLASGEPFDMVFPLKGADGNYRTFLTRVEPVKDYSGRVVRWFGTNTDVTEQKRTEEELRRVNRDLEEFTYAASHDLQEPLRMVNIYTQLIMRTLGPIEGNLSKYADIVRQNVGRMETLIQDLLKFSRAVHSEVAAEKTQADLSAALMEAMHVLKSRIEESGARVSGPLHWPAVCGDTEQLAHVFQNLISNALKYRKSGVTPEIEISTMMEGSRCTISIADNGIGFDQRHAETIFGLFKRLHRRDEYAGTGLGLAICKRIVERCGGRIWAEGRPREGATFHFTLPRFEA